MDQTMRAIAVVPGEREVRVVEQPTPTLVSPSDVKVRIDALLERRETRELVRAAIDQLPESYRTILLLRDIEELDTEETARALDITSAAVKVRLHRARQALRTLLDPGMRAGRDS